MDEFFKMTKIINITILLDQKIHYLFQTTQPWF